MTDFEPILSTPAEPRVNRALVIFSHGKGWVALWSASEDVETLVRDSGGGDTFFLDNAGFDYTPIEGRRIVVGDIEVFDDGPGDWPGSREVGLRLANVRDATSAEWTAFIMGDWPWETKP